jgi:hypothetical protein
MPTDATTWTETRFPLADSAFIPMTQEVSSFVSARLSVPFPKGGDGYLAGELPDGLTTLEDAPTVARVRVLYRSGGEKYTLKGALVGETESAPNGTWRVDGLNPAYRYDVVGSLAGYNDVIMADVQPVIGGG